MLSLIMFCWIGSALNAPSWYWWLCVIAVIKIVVNFAWSMYKAGRDA